MRMQPWIPRNELRPVALERAGGHGAAVRPPTSMRHSCVARMLEILLCPHRPCIVRCAVADPLRDLADSAQEVLVAVVPDCPWIFLVLNEIVQKMIEPRAGHRIIWTAA